MHTKKIDFVSDEIDKEYKNLIKDKKYFVLTTILDALVNEYDIVTIKKIIYENGNIKIIVNTSSNLITIYQDIQTKLISLSCDNWPYVILYDDFPNKYFFPKGKLYHYNDKTILKLINDVSHNYKYQYRIGDNNYNIKFSFNNSNAVTYDDLLKKETSFDENKFIIYLLKNNEQINRIRDLFILISKYINISEINLDISMEDGSNIEIIDNKLTNYVEYLNNNDLKLKIYLKDDKFYIDKTTTEEYQEDVIKLIKKKGE